MIWFLVCKCVDCIQMPHMYRCYATTHFMVLYTQLYHTSRSTVTCPPHHINTTTYVLITTQPHITPRHALPLFHIIYSIYLSVYLLHISQSHATSYLHHHTSAPPCTHPQLTSLQQGSAHYTVSLPATHYTLMYVTPQHPAYTEVGTCLLLSYSITNEVQVTFWVRKITGLVTY